MKTKNFILSAIMLIGVSTAVFADVKPAPIFGNAMVLQRDAIVQVWGTADSKEPVTLSFNGQTVKTRADKAGKWSVKLNPMHAGGPYKMIISGRKNRVDIDDVLVGEVWLCSGQSNMEFRVKEANNAADEIAGADYPMIRCFTVQKSMSPALLDDCFGSWEVCSSDTAGDFTAVGYFFARELWNELKVPIGIINSSWGGTDIEAWTSADSYAALPESVRRDYGNAAIELERMTSPERVAMKKKYDADFASDPALTEHWYENPGDLSTWKPMYIPKEWSLTPLAREDGHVWFRREFVLPEGAEGKAAILALGPIDDNDITWINGEEIGRTVGYNIPRRYSVGENILRKGVNTLTVRVTDTGGGGGLFGLPQDIWLNVEGKSYSLAGEWSYKPSVVTSEYGIVQYGPNMLNSLLYNAMIHPIVRFAIKGVIWYQGENNAGDAYAYRTLFPNMIADWRDKWGYDYPFYWVQLANYMAEAQIPRESAWAELREAQSMALDLPRTGQAVIIDIGDPGDIHPRNKQDVGHRLALNVLAKEYGRTDLVWTGPTYASSVVEGNKIIVTFDTYGSELAVHNKYGYIEGFAVAGSDRVFHWAKAWITEDGKVAVCSDEVDKPIAVRYAWSDDPEANLFNTEGLPAAPFRSDDWPGVTIRR
ncbi:9-O-acetylesterase [Alistipes sp. An116]|uniref:sialate O-acetylesterase n=1 Tax=Alistipes sp. An116 TaxID=1965546 RepID=UPI000B38AD6A|nr:sialate O-acetylesterase [Alistipes sp. An116]OUQ53224.1 9-O-acetylesterase [Alistipes sp. An116]